MSTIFYAVKWKPQEFLERALKCQHPCESTIGCEKETHENIKWICSAPDSEISAFRANAFQSLIQMASECNSQEQELHQNLHPKLRAVLKSEKLTLFCRLVAIAKVEDPKNCAIRSKKGLKSWGTKKRRVSVRQHLFQPHAQKKSCKGWRRGSTLEWKQSRAGVNQRRQGASVMKRCCTRQMAQGGCWALTKDQLDRQFPKGWVASRRFGVTQGPKTRLRRPCGPLCLSTYPIVRSEVHARETMEKCSSAQAGL